MIKTNKKECSTASFEMKDAFVYVKFKDDSIIDLPEAKIHAKICIDLCNGKKFPFIIDCLNITLRVEEDARMFFSEFAPMREVIKGTAVLANVTQTKFLARYYIKHHKPGSKNKLFDNLQDALDWIKTLD